MAVETNELSQDARILGFLSEGGEGFISGEALSNRLGLSRTAVWKHVEALRLKGYRIEAVPAKGYRLVGRPDRLSSLEVHPLLTTRVMGRVLHHHETIGSTNATAFRLAQDGAPHGTVVVAEQQTAGKGRRGRAWVSPPGLNLYFSAILRPALAPQHAPELTLVAAVALAEALREAGSDAAIKWPNDVQLGGQKVAGILTELSAEPERVHFVIVGVGVNLNAGPEHFPEELRDTATSLSQVLGRSVARAAFTAALWARLEAWLDTYLATGFDAVRTRWKALSSTLGQQVRVRTDRGDWEGFAEDIDPTGALMVRTADGRVERVLAGDVEQLRPQGQTRPQGRG
ncbi:biotin--[acetyl-CoA-carboxylase] ligase [Corallococcus sp. bb12-1]|uniref:biotin--[acetyl-CoA-carboxylase] ligase n=1 Tax=Corallococcus sp. bb12-1 TaxID=2996784 RepID=UPI00226FDE01|nr:biotin--[acetyl-CoA-carboxylase] ligase [Corallococcus sp. bb12-1]MCY1047351.1 biotin--[acetyl-CoA-carboxylase] ligase [Corallococcus sp. bb12-1]